VSTSNTLQTKQNNLHAIFWPASFEENEATRFKGIHFSVTYLLIYLFLSGVSRGAGKDAVGTMQVSVVKEISKAKGGICI